jgi:hypothetical protein
MSSTLVLDNVQLGSDVDPTKNLIIKTNKDGTFLIERADGTDVATISTGGVIIPKAPGSVIQSRVTTDAGSTFTATTLANRSAALQTITPLSTNSVIRVQCSFYGYAGQRTGGGNYLNVRLYENNTTAIGTSLVSLGVVNTPANSQAFGCWTLEALVTNTALTARSFSIWGANSATPDTTSGSINNCVWTLTEIAA